MTTPWGLARALHSKGVLGLNCRNAEYILRYNRRKQYPLVDDKFLTKQLALKAGIAVPELYEVVEIQRQTRGLSRLMKKYGDFVVKPSKGSGGEGVIIITGYTKGLFRKANGLLMSEAEMSYHLSLILSGVYSLGGATDKALIEYRVKFDPVFDEVSYLGVPDVRIVVFLGVPVMAMVRLPTRMSDGKANLHQGAIGAGIDIATGKLLSAVWRNSITEEHPDTGKPVRGLQVPGWRNLLTTAASCFELTGLGYIGVDLVLDKEKGPLLLELNARPGLNIQIANRTGLEKRLKTVKGVDSGSMSPEQRVDFAIAEFDSARSLRLFSGCPA